MEIRYTFVTVPGLDLRRRTERVVRRAHFWSLIGACALALFMVVVVFTDMDLGWKWNGTLYGWLAFNHLWSWLMNSARGHWLEDVEARLAQHGIVGVNTWALLWRGQVPGYRVQGDTIAVTSMSPQA